MLTSCTGAKSKADGAAAGAAEDDAEPSSSAAAKAKAATHVDGADEAPPEKELSKRAKKRMKRLSIAELKQLVTRPEVVEVRPSHSAVHHHAAPQRPSTTTPPHSVRGPQCLCFLFLFLRALPA